MLQQLKDKNIIWFANEQSTDNSYLASGYRELDYITGGFPSSGIIEVKSLLGSGEIRLLLHYLLKKSDQEMIAVINPPSLLSNEFLLQQNINLDQLIYINTDSIDDALWSVEYCLKSGLCPCVLLWQNSFSFKSIRRLNLACETNGSSLIVYTIPDSTPMNGVKLSLSLHPTDTDLKIIINKAKGKVFSKQPIINMQNYWPRLYEQKRPIRPDKSFTFAS
ncbi:MAG: hypothetical protein HWE10_08910 [Gammaproteobacteria bacterium]|nr:hypothetical protein [Gammaproteobacteria bacterium]